MGMRLLGVGLITTSGLRGIAMEKILNSYEGIAGERQRVTSRSLLQRMTETASKVFWMAR